MSTVILMQAVAKQYRRRFLANVHAFLGEEGISFHCLYSVPPPSEAAKGDNIDLDWPIGKRIPGQWLLSDRILIQPLAGFSRPPDLLVAELALKHALQPWQRWRQRVARKRFAFMGPARPTQGAPSSWPERLKVRVAQDADWWFPYTEGGRRYLERAGFPADRISTLWNSIDTADFRAAIPDDPSEARKAARLKLGLPQDAPVLLFCGSLYRGKRLDLVLDAYRLAKRSLPGLHLIVVGKGPDAALVEALSAVDTHCHALGPRFGTDKAEAFLVADALLLPAYAGLAVVDALVAGLPILTTDCPGHGAEFDYVEPGVNAVMTQADAEALSRNILAVMSDPVWRGQLAQRARASGTRFSAEAMAERFVNGTLACLRQPPRNR
ncbi:MAG: glycosyltransferase family 4 protein [Candidatus Sericytochromatia bacterium]|nr:glycosyltransferase family 4 protein [Candidatus Tanganyikabacteria bacterium]